MSLQLTRPILSATAPDTHTHTHTHTHTCINRLRNELDELTLATTNFERNRQISRPYLTLKEDLAKIQRCRLIGSRVEGVGCRFGIHTHTHTGPHMATHTRLHTHLYTRPPTHPPQRKVEAIAGYCIIGGDHHEVQVDHHDLDETTCASQIDCHKTNKKKFGLGRCS